MFVSLSLPLSSLLVKKEAKAVAKEREKEKRKEEEKGGWGENQVFEESCG